MSAETVCHLKFTAFFLSLSAFFGNEAWALPAYSRLFQAKYGYPVSCALCHTSGGGSSTTDYGRDFLRAGANSSAFAKIEGKDSDQDGFKNIDEIKAKSNPGDARSKPGNLGDWLSASLVIALPEKQLRKIFPDAETLSSLDGTLKEDQVRAVEAILGAPLTDEDKVPSFYFALKGGKKFGVAQFVSAKTSEGLVSIAVALDTNAEVTAVTLLKNPGSKVLESSVFLKQFVGKTQADKLMIGQDIQSAKGAESSSKAIGMAVKRAIIVMNEVFRVVKR